MFFTVEVSGYAGDSVEGQISIPKNLHEGGYVEVVHSESGGVVVVEVKKKKMTIPAVSEKAVIHIRAPRGIVVNLKTSSGNIAAEGFETDVIRLKSSSGKIRARDLSAPIETASSSGSQDIQQCKGNLTVKSSSGRIRFEFENDFDDFSFDLQSGSGMLRVGESRVKGTFILGNGPIKITGKSSSGSQEYR